MVFGGVVGIKVVKNFNVELNSCSKATSNHISTGFSPCHGVSVYIRDVIVDNLQKCDLAFIRHGIERLSLYVRSLHRLPLQVFFCQLGVGCLFSLSCHGSYCFGAIFGLLGSYDIGETVNLSKRIKV
jgi:hypothetical protein